jgi:hypothetical protein
MTTHARLAGLIRRYNRKTLALALCVLIVIAVVARGIGAAAYSPAGTGPAQPQAVVSAGTGGSAATGDAGSTSTASDGAAPSGYLPSVDDLTGNTVVYDDGTGDQMDYVPPFDAGS